MLLLGPKINWFIEKAPSSEVYLSFNLNFLVGAIFYFSFSKPKEALDLFYSLKFWTSIGITLLFFFDYFIFEFVMVSFLPYPRMAKLYFIFSNIFLVLFFCGLFKLFPIMLKAIYIGFRKKLWQKSLFWFSYSSFFFTYVSFA